VALGLLEWNILWLLSCWEVLCLSNLIEFLTVGGSLAWSFGGLVLSLCTLDLVFGAAIVGYYTTLWRLSQSFEVHLLGVQCRSMDLQFQVLSWACISGLSFLCWFYSVIVVFLSALLPIFGE
jgi:hypothetical protein